jgi:hypothetical protein
MSATLSGSMTKSGKKMTINESEMSFEKQVSFDLHSVNLEIPFAVSWMNNSATDKLHKEFEDHRSEDERFPLREERSFLTSWPGYVVLILTLTFWALV